MKKELAKLALGATFVLFSASSFAYVDIDERLDKLEKSMKEISARNPQETLGAAFVTSRPNTVGNNWFATFDVIYWHSKMGGTEYAFTSGSSDIITTNANGNISIKVLNPSDGSVKENGLGWDLGLKVGLGYKTPHDSWDVFGRYTWLRSNKIARSTKNPPSFLIALKSLASLIVERAKSSIDIDYKNVELELARAYFISSNLSLRPHLDVKTVWLNLKQDATYNFSTLIQTEVTGLDFKVKESSKLWGIGPRVGIDGKLFIGYGFSIHGDIAGSILYGYFKTRHKDTWPLVQSGGGTVLSIKDKMHRFVPFVQTFMGLGWETFINNDKQHLSFKAGYEAQYYWRVNQMAKLDQSLTFSIPNPSATTPGRAQVSSISEDLMFYGITTEARLDF